MTMSDRRYSDLVRFETFMERYEYLKLGGGVGLETFGYDRYLNQLLYRSEEWKKFRREIIIRDNGCDLGCEGFSILGNRLTVHHINPITKEDILNHSPIIFDPDNVITCTHSTHMAIHYGTLEISDIQPIIRTPNDTCPWKK